MSSTRIPPSQWRHLLFWDQQRGRNVWTHSTSAISVPPPTLSCCTNELCAHTLVHVAACSQARKMASRVGQLAPGSGLGPEKVLRSAAGLHTPEGSSPQRKQSRRVLQKTCRTSVFMRTEEPNRCWRRSVGLSHHLLVSHVDEGTLAGRLSHFCQPHMDFLQRSMVCVPAPRSLPPAGPDGRTRNQTRDACLHCLTVHVCLRFFCPQSCRIAHQQPLQTPRLAFGGTSLTRRRWKTELPEREPPQCNSRLDVGVS